MPSGWPTRPSVSRSVVLLGGRQPSPRRGRTGVALRGHVLTPPARPARDPAAVEDKTKLALDLKESIEIVLTGEYSAFLQAFFKPLCDILRTQVPPQLSDNAEHKLRSAVLDVLTRLPHNEALRPHISELYEVCFGVVQHDNQDNAVPAIKLLFELHKIFRGMLEPQGAQMAQFVVKVCTCRAERSIDRRSTRMPCARSTSKRPCTNTRARTHTQVHAFPAGNLLVHKQRTCYSMATHRPMARHVHR